MSTRCAAALNAALAEALERWDEALLLGEDLADPYGGAFRITRGLSTRFPDRVLSSPISEAALFGVSAGLALRGRRPVLEIMFGDFITLGLDQVINHIAKFREMYDEQVRVPLVVRTPMGGRRGYGPTHSQCLEKLLLGIPGLTVVAGSEYHDLHRLLLAAIASDDPVFFIENKLLYNRFQQRGRDGRLGPFLWEEGDSMYPTVQLRAADRCSVSVVTWGGMAHLARQAAEQLAIEHETMIEVLILSRLAPVDLTPLLASVRRTGALVVAEEGTLTGGVGAEIVARVQHEAFSSLRGPARRVAARDAVIPAARHLEDAVLPQVEDITDACLAAAGGTEH